jgi:hypothetical protein
MNRRTFLARTGQTALLAAAGRVATHARVNVIAINSAFVSAGRRTQADAGRQIQFGLGCEILDRA